MYRLEFIVIYKTGGSKLVNLERSKIEKLSFEKTKKWILLIFSFKIVRIYNKLVDIKILLQSDF